MRWKRWSWGVVVRRWVLGGVSLTIISCVLFKGFERQIEAWESSAGIPAREQRFLVVYTDGFARLNARHRLTNSFIDANVLTGMEDATVTRLLMTYREDTWPRIPAGSAPEWLAETGYPTTFGSYHSIHTYGWPWRALRADSWGHRTAPLLLGTTLNTLVLGALVLPIAWLLPDSADLKRWCRRLSGKTKLERGLCTQCGYDLRAKYDDGCPECAWHKGGSVSPEKPSN